jgi:hypothetical protein
MDFNGSEDAFLSWVHALGTPSGGPLQDTQILEEMIENAYR